MPKTAQNEKPGPCFCRRILNTFAAMYGNKRILSFHLITLLFTVLFFLIKVSPYYFTWQYAPTRSENSTSQSVQAQSRRHDVHIVIDKSITENKELQVPAIGFAGILFSLLVFAFPAVSTRPKFPSYITHPPLTCRLALLRVRRL